MRFFLAGVMQGSRQDKALHDQSYRQRLRELLPQYFPEADIYDPLAPHPESPSYDDRTGREVFLGHNQMCSEVDVVVAYVPTASMGTAIEMWEAYRHGRAVITISPMPRNWVIKFCSHLVLPDWEAFEEGLISGAVQQRIQEVLAS